MNNDLADLFSIYYIGSWYPWRFKQFHNKLKQLEKELTHWYPLGDDKFKINHGKDYYAFFHRLGNLTYQVAWLDGNVVATGAGIRRAVEAIHGSNLITRTWYLCDLKVHPKYQGRKLSLKIFLKALPMGYIKCPRMYGISMNPNQIVKKLANLSSNWCNIKQACQLNLYSMNYDQMLSIENILENERGQLGYLDLNGIKDIILKSTGQPMKLLHVQFGLKFRRNYNLTKNGLFIRDWNRIKLKPQKNYQHMFCCPDNDIITKLFKQKNIPIHSTATIYHHGMDQCDWKFILTSDI